MIVFLTLCYCGVLALLVKLTSKGPIIFKQKRYGLDGKEIQVWKFRSMTVTEDGIAYIMGPHTVVPVPSRPRPSMITSSLVITRVSLHVPWIKIVCPGRALSIARAID